LRLNIEDVEEKGSWCAPNNVRSYCNSHARKRVARTISVIARSKATKQSSLAWSSWIASSQVLLAMTD
jgi:hypothetical protein